jgi:hypothetical protein
MVLEADPEEGYPATVKIVKEGSSLVVHISLKGTWGTGASPDLCRFYDEFGKNARQASTRAQTKQSVLSSQRLPKEEKKSSPPPAGTQKTSHPTLSRGEILWAYVNLREGPGTQYKIIGKAYKKNTFEILAENPTWLRIRLENGAEGWVSKNAASEAFMPPPTQSPPASSSDSSETKPSSELPRPM